MTHTAAAIRSEPGVTRDVTSPVAEDGPRHGLSGTRFFWACVLSAVGIATAFAAWSDIFNLASRDEEASHIFLVPFVVVWLVWVRQKRLRVATPTNNWVGTVLVALGWMALYFGEVRLWQSVWHLGAILIAVGCFVSVMGFPVVRLFLPAFVVLVFLIPVPGRVRQQIAIPMQNATAQLTEGICEVVGIPLTRSGNLLTINGNDIAIAEACNGLRMVFALGLVCYAFAFGNPLRLYARILILVATPIAAIVCNVVRLVPTVYLYGYHPAEVADKFHDISGWVMIFVAFLALMGILRLLKWAMIPIYKFNLAYD
jgi:exosortase